MIACSQTTSQTDSVCFSYEQARMILQDLTKVKSQDTIISNLKVIVKNDSTIIEKHRNQIINLKSENSELETKVAKEKKKVKPAFLFGLLLGLASHLLL